MRKKLLSLSLATLVLASSASCGGATTSLYRGTSSLGDKISNNINKIINDTEENMNNAKDMTFNNTYSTDFYGNRVYTNKLSNGYANEYTKIDTNYNGVEKRFSTDAIENNISNTVKKSNSMDVIPIKNNNKKVSKRNDIVNIPIHSKDSTSPNTNNYPVGTTTADANTNPMIIA